MSRHFWATIGLCLMGFAATFLWQQSKAAPPKREVVVTPTRLAIPAGAQTATFAGGCFWGVEETFRMTQGVINTQAGYTGGTLENPTYEAVHRDKTGHVEAVEVLYDPQKVTYVQLLTVFFKSHDGTHPGKNDVAMGAPYRSFVFCKDVAQEKAAQEMIRHLATSKAYKGAPRPLMTQVRLAQTFWPAEEYHQRYYEKRGAKSVCSL
jgi:peptide-methionine (S)-S-oxide reductase